MLPILFTLPGGAAISTWGLLLVLLMVGLATLGHRWTKAEGGYPDDLALEVTVLVFAVAILGKGLLNTVVLGAGGLAAYLAWRRVAPLRFFDLVAPLLAVGQAVGRLGCLAAGCCHGKPTGWVWGLTFSHPDSLAEPKGIPLHPTQLLEAGACALLAVALIRIRRRPHFAGQVALTWLTLYPAIRLSLEPLRGDTLRGWFLEGWLGQAISLPQGLSLCLLGLAVIGWLILPRRSWGR